MRRQLGTTTGRGSYTYLLVFSSPTPWVTLRCGCGSTASLPRTGSVQLGLCSVGFSLPAALRGLSLDFVLIVTWWMHVPAPAVDVGSSTDWTS